MPGASSGVAAQKDRRNGQKSIEAWRENWKEAGCSKDSSTLVGRMKVNAKLVTRRKAQKSTGSAIAQNGTRSDGRFRSLQKVGTKKRQLQRKSGSGKGVLSRILSVKASGTEANSV